MKYSHWIVILCFILTPMGVNAGQWFKTDKTNCKIWNLISQTTDTVTWSGECVNGYTSGFGTEVWYKNGKEFKPKEKKLKRFPPCGNFQFPMGKTGDS